MEESGIPCQKSQRSHKLSLVGNSGGNLVHHSVETNVDSS